MKLIELAKELDIASKEVVEKAKTMGFEVSSSSSALSDIDTTALKNALLRSKLGAETKIIKVKPKTQNAPEQGETPRVTVKAAPRPPVRPTKPKTQAAAPAAKTADTSAAAAKPAASAPARVPAGTAATAAPSKSAAPSGSAPIKRIPSDKIPVRIARPAAPEPVPEPIEKVIAAVPAASTDTKTKKGQDAAGKAAEAETDTVLPIEAADQSQSVSEDKTNDSPEAAAQDAGNTSAPESASTSAPQETGHQATSPAQGTARPSSSAPQHGETAGKHSDEKPSDGKSSDGKHSDGKPSDKVKKKGKPEGEKEKEKPRHSDSLSKTKDKKPFKARDAAKPETPEERARRRSLRPDKKGLPTEDFKGSKRSPILEDSSLEKRTMKSKSRPRTLPKAEQIPVFNPEDLEPGTVIITVPITVAGFAEQIEKTPSEVIMALMGLGIMANVNQNLDEDTVHLLAEELGVMIYVGSDEGEVVELGLEDYEDKEEDLKSRPPIITVMGHVDHGKTSILDAIRKTNVTGGEAGGITQHIGASEVTINGERIVFLDTPGHEAFTAMRARGAHTTDIAVLVVAADDGVKPQTIESISHAKAAGVPIIVAINKVDKDGANLDKVRQDLADHGILVEEWGGQTISVPVSAKTGEGVKTLLEMILLQAEVLELKANPDRYAKGTVIEARLDKNKGAVATLLVLNGTLKSGMSFVAGITSGRIRAMTDFSGKPIKSAGPATAVEVTGLTEVPQAGDEFNAVKEDRVAREIAETRRIKQREEIMTRTSSTSLEKLFSQIQVGEIKELNIIIKGDVQGSVGALTAALEKLENENVKVRIIHTGVGTVTESDVMLANTSAAVIIGFNVRPSTAVTSMAENEGVEIRSYRVIYDVINDVEAALKGMLDPEFKEVILGKLEIRETFKVPGAGLIGGAYVLEGKVQRNAEVRLVRDGIVIHSGKISSLRRFKDDAREVAAGYECGIGIENYNDIKEGDIIEAFTMEEVER